MPSFECGGLRKAQARKYQGVEQGPVGICQLSLYQSPLRLGEEGRFFLCVLTFGQRDSLARVVRSTLVSDHRVEGRGYEAVYICDGLRCEALCLHALHPPDNVPVLDLGRIQGSEGFGNMALMVAF